MKQGDRRLAMRGEAASSAPSSLLPSMSSTHSAVAGGGRRRMQDAAIGVSSLPSSFLLLPPFVVLRRPPQRRRRRRPVSALVRTRGDAGISIRREQVSAQLWSRLSLILLLASSNFRYAPLLPESFLRLRRFSPDECIMTGSLIEWDNVNVAIVLLGRALSSEIK